MTVTMSNTQPNSSSQISGEQTTSVYICRKCSHPVGWDCEGVLCEGCDNWFHIECQQIHSDQYSKLGHSSVVWTCSVCDTDHHSTAYPAILFDSQCSNTSLPSVSSIDCSADSITDITHKPILTSSPTKARPKSAANRPLRLINVNCQSLSGKKGAWAHLIQTTQPDIIIATETWLDGSVSNSELESDMYTIYRKDRSSGIRGGVLIALNSTINSNEVNIKSNSEILWVKIQCPKQHDIFIAACYRPNVTNTTFTADLKSGILEISRRRRPAGLIIGGDFNFPGWDWSTCTLKPGTQHVMLHQEFKTLLDDHGLTQIITEPTREQNTLDLIATNMPDQICRTKIIPGISDHEIAFTEISVKPNYSKQPKRKVWLFNKADWEGLRAFLKPRLDMMEMAYNPSPDSLWKSLKDVLHDGMKTFIPRRNTKSKDSAPWITKEIRKMTTTRDRLYRRSRDRGQEKTEKRFRMYKQLCKKELRRAHAKYVHKLFTDESKSKEELSKRFWTYVKHRRSHAVSTIGPLRRGDQLITQPEVKANLLNDQFTSVFSAKSPRLDYEHHTLHSKMKEIKVCKKGVLKQLKSLKINKAAGPDDLHPRVLKELADVLAGPLTTLFQTSLDKGVVPLEWKTALVSPIYKKGEKYIPANYRPVSLTCVLSKVMEHIVTSHLMSFAESNNILYKHQHGFRKNRSCEKQLIEFVADITNNLDNGIETDACIMDFSKAFDKVNHHKLLLKLAEYGVSYQVTAWVEAFLTGRTQRVVVEGKQSDESCVSSGVPQGSVIGPALFLFYINDMPLNTDSTVRLFADDTIIYNSASSHKTLQDDLCKLEEWEARTDMEFHPDKCQHILFSRKRNQIVNNYRLHDTIIPKTDKVKYLGVTLDDKLTFKEHVQKTANKANAALGFVRRTVTTSSSAVKCTAYKQLVRPTLEYAAGAWDSVSKTSEAELEAVQRRAGRMVFNIKRTDRKTSTTGLLKDLKLPTLVERRKQARLKLFQNYHYNSDHTIDNYIQRSKSTPKRKHKLQYLIPHSNTQHHQRSFFIKTAKEWNALPEMSDYLKPPDI